MSTVAAAARRAATLFVEPAPPAPASPLDVVVAALSAGAGAATVARGLAFALKRARPVALSLSGRDEVAAGPGTAVVRTVGAGEIAGRCHRGPGRVLVAVADGRREPAVAAIVHGVLCRRHDQVVLVANRARDVDSWAARGAVCIPDSRLGAVLLARGHRAPGAMGAAFDDLAARLGPSSSVSDGAAGSPQAGSVKRPDDCDPLERDDTFR